MKACGRTLGGGFPEKNQCAAVGARIGRLGEKPARKFSLGFRVALMRGCLNAGELRDRFFPA